MEKSPANLESIMKKVRGQLAAQDAAREQVLRLSREIIRHSANTIRAIHRQEWEVARGLLAGATNLLTELKQALVGNDGLRNTGFVHDAQKEYAEANLTLALVSGANLPDPDELGVSYPAYLNGLGEAVGELRRHLLDLLRQGETARCEAFLGVMDDIYGELVTMDFPDALTGGLRRTTDVVRSIMEKTRGDLTATLRQHQLAEKLEAFQERLDKKGF